MTPDEWNASRLPISGSKGHYESWFLRANHPAEPKALWLRHTFFRPAGNPEATCGELWAAWFDEKVRGVRQELPLGRCYAGTGRLDLSFGDARWTDGEARGEANNAGHSIAWDLRYERGGEPTPLYGGWAYKGPLPKAKQITVVPHAMVSGRVVVDGESFEVSQWPGCQSHNWGERHTDEYAWMQVSGFDQAPDAYLEGGTGRVKIGGRWSPQLSAAVLRFEGQRYLMSKPLAMLRAEGKAGGLGMDVRMSTREIDLRWQVEAPRERFIAFKYRNPPGGALACLNSKIARLELTVTPRGKPSRTLTTSRAALELLVPEDDPRVTTVGGYPAGE
jgi:hypothetical protein